MFCTDVVPSAHDAALQERERGLNGVGVDHAMYVFSAVIDGLVGRALLPLERPRIDRRFVSHNHFHILTEVLPDNLAHSLGVCIARMDESQFPVALADSENDFLFFAGHPAASLTADIGFVNFDRAIHHRFVGFDHRGADSVAEVPRCFVAADSESALDLASGHSLFRFTEKERGREPLFKRQVRVVENRASGDGELVVAVFAVEQLLCGFKLDHVAFAAQAARTFRPAQTRQQFAALGFGRKHRVYVN